MPPSQVTLMGFLNRRRGWGWGIGGQLFRVAVPGRYRLRAVSPDLARHRLWTTRVSIRIDQIAGQIDRGSGGWKIKVILGLKQPRRRVSASTVLQRCTSPLGPQRLMRMGHIKTIPHIREGNAAGLGAADM